MQTAYFIGFVSGWTGAERISGNCACGFHRPRCTLAQSIPLWQLTSCTNGWKPQRLLQSKHSSADSVGATGSLKSRGCGARRELSKRLLQKGEVKGVSDD